MSLTGKKIALLESRMTSELAALVRKQGGEPVSVPALAEVPVDCTREIPPVVELLQRETEPLVVLSSGVGAAALFEAARQIEMGEPFCEALRQSVTVCRGPKPAGVLSKEDVQVSVRVREPHTTADLIEALAHFPLSERWVVVQHYGERNETLMASLQHSGAQVRELMSYRWSLPADVSGLRELVHRIISGEIHAIAFTSQIQVRHLLQVAEAALLLEPLLLALRSKVAVASIGPTCTAALNSRGIPPNVIPEHPKMAPMVSALSRYLANE
ncbi:MAG: uroporphyrinogen-III synthase [Myxococcaceae bacterium]